MSRPSEAGKLPLTELLELKRRGQPIVMVTAYDFPTGRLADAAGIDVVLVGDSAAMTVLGHESTVPATMDEMITLARAATRGARRPLVVGDMPFGSFQVSDEDAVRNGIRFVKEAGVDLVKVDGAADHLDAVTAITRAGIPVFAQFGITPQTALRYGVEYRSTPSAADQVPVELTEELVAEARRLEAAGAVLLNFTNSGPVVGAAVAAAVSVPVLGGFGGGPWLDGRMRMAHAAIGYAASAVDDPPDTYANVARTTLDALTRYADDVRAARQLPGGLPVPTP